MCFVTYIQTEQECNGTDVRLVDGETEFDGSVEICQNGLWVPVCDDMWNYRKAQIVCEQLGYSGSKLILTAYYTNVCFGFRVLCLETV